VVKKEGYPTNYEFTGESIPVTIEYSWKRVRANVVGYQETIVHDYWGHDIPPCGFWLLQLENGQIISVHDRFITW
jgi:hypothetical protein